jgi:ABC-2 type transport system permease protein
MDEHTLTLHRRSQLAAIAELRWRMFVNGLRTRHGKAELFSRILVTAAFAFGGLGGFSAGAGLAWYLVSQGKAELLTLLLWPVFFFWQVFPVMATAFTSNPDSSDLLRFPLNYSSYFSIRLVYGLFDAASALGCLGLLGILVGVAAARPALLPWALIVLLTFALFNLVLMQTVFAWLERWLAQRRTREILGVVFILFMLSFQLIGPTIERVSKGPQPGLHRATEILTQVQSVLPPGMAAAAIAQVSRAEYVAGFASLLLLGILVVALGALLHLRLRAQFRGENLSEAGARPAVATTQRLQLGWELPWLSPAVAAVFEKEMRYLARSGPMLLTLIMPIFMLVIFRLGPMRPGQQGHFMTRAPEMAFPGAAAYALLVLTNLVYNSFGGDGGGIQFFYASPVSFRQIVLGKNLLHAGILILNTALAWFAVSYFYGTPALAVTVSTMAAVLFAAPLNFAAGNLLSVYSPKRRDFAAFGRQNVSQLTLLASLGMQVLIVGTGVAAFMIARYYKNLWIAAVIFLGLAVISISIYALVLRRFDRIAMGRREALLAALCRA